MQIRNAMTRDVRTASPDDSLRDAALSMAEIDAGVLPVSDDGRLVGMITDRDIAVRGVAQGLSPDTRVGDVMTREVRYCFDDEECETVLRNMGDIQVRRLPVVDRAKRLVGIVSLADLAVNGSAASAGRALEAITQPGGAHTQRIH